MKDKAKDKIHDLGFEALLKTFEYNQHWINLADTKAGLVLTINGVIAGFMLKYLIVWKNAVVEKSLAPWMLSVGIIMLSGYFLLQFVSFLFTVKVFFPRTLKVDHRKTRHVFAVGIAKEFPQEKDAEDFWKECKQLSVNDYKREYAYQLHNDAIICCRKYNSLKVSLKTMLWAMLFAFATFVYTAIFLNNTVS